MSLKYKFTIKSANHELIGVFSKQCGEWGSGSDGLTWHVSSCREDFAFRTKIFGKFPVTTYYDIRGNKEVGREYTAELKLWNNGA